MALALEDLDSDVARVHESSLAVKTSAEGPPAEARSRRKPLPDHLPREDIRLDVDSQACACCGGALHAIGESVSEMLDWVPAQLRVMRIARPKYACRACGTIAQAPAPERPIAGGLATPALLAQVLIAKHCDHTALSSVANLRPSRDRSRALDAGGLGRRRLLVAGSPARAAVQECLRLQPYLCRRYASSGARSRPRASENGTTVGLRARTTAMVRA
jgi:transposase